MHPVLFQWGPAALSTYTVLVSLAFFVGAGVWILQGRRLGWSTERMVHLSLMAALWGWLGARALFVLTQWDRYLADPLRIFMVWEGGVVFLGGFLAATAYLLRAIPAEGIPLRKGLSTAAAAVAWAHAVGRLGCFFNGCCHGSRCDLPWAVTFEHPFSAAQPLGVPLHPSQLYEVLGLVLLGGLILWSERRPRPLGQGWRLYLLGYSALRFFVEFTRGDGLRGAWAGLSTSQWICVVLFLTALLLDLRGREDHNHAS
jgi:phosphatidylglycerol:prolipoprotein diacylglycerol transferase